MLLFVSFEAFIVVHKLVPNVTYVGAAIKQKN